MTQNSEQPTDAPPLRIPVEIEVFVNPDGSVTFADLEVGVISIARHLNPDQEIACGMPERSSFPEGSGPKIRGTEC